MKIIFLKSNAAYETMVEQSMIICGIETISMSAPSSEASSALFLQQFIQYTQNDDIDFVFSLGFLPFVSLACGAQNMRYVCWLIESWKDEYFSKIIKNEWNQIFCMHKAVCQELIRCGVQHVYYLPFGAGVCPSQLEKQNDIQVATDALPDENEFYKLDAALYGGISDCRKDPSHPFYATGPMKDSTKGYLEGCIACCHQLPQCFPVAERLPDYVKNDLLAFYNPDMSETLAGTDWILNHRYFYPLITDANRELFYAYLKKERRLSKIKIYGEVEKADSVSFEVVSSPAYNELPEIAFHSKINLIIPERNFHGDLSPIAWQILGAKGFLLYMGEQRDLYPKGMSNTVFRTARDMMQKVAYYLGRDKERQVIAEEIYQDILKNHTCSHRIREILEIIQS